MTATPPALLTALLRDVSRSFYITLRLLPAPVRSQIGLAYLLARATDTIADTEIVPVCERLDALDRLRDRILGDRSEFVDFSTLASNQGLPAERELLARIEEAIAVLAALPSFDRDCIRDVIRTIVGGQALDLHRFGTAGADRIVALASAEELDDYTFRVAGCVGGFWTRLCHAHLFPDAPLDMTAYLGGALRFGKGLQLVNVLRDLPADLRKGRCYLPANDLQTAGLTPADLRNPGSMSRVEPVYRRHLELAAGHLAAGWRYTCATPVNQMRVRVACALPLLIGAETLRLLAAGNVLDASRRIKVPRARVRALLLKAFLLHPFRRRWERLFPTDPLPASNANGAIR